MTNYSTFIKDTSVQGVEQGVLAAFEYYREKVIRELDKRHTGIFTLFFIKKYTLINEKIAKISHSYTEDMFQQIDRDYISSLKESMMHIHSDERRQLKKIIGSYFDLLNLYNLVKFRLLYRQTTEETLLYMLPFAENFTIDILSKLCSVNSLQQLSNAVEPILGNKFDDYETFRNVIYAYHRRQLLSVWSAYPFSIAIPFSVLRLIEIEASDLIAVSQGVSFGLDNKEIMTMVVGD
jgi:vacuolar-type H+-ATPase subunit C/Vma6